MGEGLDFKRAERIERGEEGRGGEKFTGIAGVGVCFCLALCEFEIVFGGDCVEGGFAAAEELAGGAVAGKERGGKGRC